MSLNYCQKDEDDISNLVDSLVGKELFRPNLDSLKKVLSCYQISKYKVITVGGTNGKGETSLKVNALLLSQGFKSAIFTSPHILSLKERFFINGQYPSYEELKLSINKVQQVVLKNKVVLSYFEFVLIIFLELVERSKVEVIVLEVGLGGRLDATNLIDSDISVITSISRDHVEVLGNSFKKILFEKLGITRKNRPLFTAFQLKYLLNLTKAFTREKSIIHRDLIEEGIIQGEYDFKKRNTHMAIEVVNEFVSRHFPKKKLLKTNFANSEELLKKYQFSFKGKGEKLTSGLNRYIFLGAHNLEGMRCLHESKLLNSIDEVWLSFSKRKVSELKAMMGIICQQVDLKKITICQFSHFKACEDEVLKDLAGEFNVNYVNNWQSLFVSNKKEKSIFVGGSYYFIGSIQTYLINHI